MISTSLIIKPILLDSKVDGCGVYEVNGISIYIVESFCVIWKCFISHGWFLGSYRNCPLHDYYIYELSLFRHEIAYSSSKGKDENNRGYEVEFLVMRNLSSVGVSLFLVMSFFVALKLFIQMSQEVKNNPSTPVSDDEMNENERLRIRKNCRKEFDSPLQLATSAHIPPQSPDHAPPLVNNSDDHCKPVHLPRPISL